MTHATSRPISTRCANRIVVAEVRRALLGVGALLLVPICAAAQAPDAQKPVPPGAAAPADDGQWTMPAKNYASTRYSELKQITPDTVKNLQVAFTFSTGLSRGE